jgi:hypothetical protein
MKFASSDARNNAAGPRASLADGAPSMFFEPGSGDHQLGTRTAAAADSSIRDYQFKSPQWTVGKNFDDTGAFGSWDELPLGMRGLRLQTRLNGKVVQDRVVEPPQICWRATAHCHRQAAGTAETAAVTKPSTSNQRG